MSDSPRLRDTLLIPKTDTKSKIFLFPSFFLFPIVPIFLFLFVSSEEESEESSSGEVEIEQEMSSDPEDPRELHPGALLHRSSRLHNLPLMAEALAHGADVHAGSEEEEGKTPLIQAVIGVRHRVCSAEINSDPSYIIGFNKYYMKSLWRLSARVIN